MIDNINDKNNSSNLQLDQIEKINQIDAQSNERAFLLAVDCGQYDADVSMAELAELATTSGAIVVANAIQKRPAPSVSTYVGSGMLEQVCDICKANDVDLIIADGELTPVQLRNIENITNIRVIDRTMLILDIFAGRAQSSEGKLQVELAQLKYSVSRLTGKGTSLSRLGGGIGTRGPGETKLETDKRHIRSRIQSLKNQLDKVEKRRESMHQRRQKNGVQTVAIVGYTNAGKSTLMNKLTNAGVLQMDKLFATLDPTARKLFLPNSKQVMLVDTVGLVRRLPHQLVDAFRSTLEEAVWADVILNVCDASSSECGEHIKVTADLLADLGCGNKPIINVLNKCDKGICDDNYYLDQDLIGSLNTQSTVKISALTGEGIEDLLVAITNALPQSRKKVKILLPFDKIKYSALVRDNGTVYSEEYVEHGLIMVADVEIAVISKLKDYIVLKEM